MSGAWRSARSGTVNAAIAAFYIRCNSFLDNKPITQQTDRNILEAFRAKHGSKPIAGLERRHIENMLAEKTGKPAAQRNLLRVLRVLLAFCVMEGLRKDNPALGIKLRAQATSGYHSWTEEELRQYEQRHPIGSKPRLALALLLYTAQRRADVVRLGPPNVRDGWLRFTQSKTGTEMEIPLVAPLADIIAATPMVGVKTFLVTDYGRPFTPAGFGGWFRDQCDWRTCAIAAPTVSARRFCGAWQRPDVLRTTSPALAAIRTCARSGLTFRQPTRRAWLAKAWRRLWRASPGPEGERHDCQT